MKDHDNKTWTLVVDQCFKKLNYRYASFETCAS
jgi:hypothetical protein